MKKVILILLILSLILVVGCSPYGKTQTTEKQVAELSANEITIQDFAFSPQTLEIKVGESVKWANKDSAPHTVDFNDFKSNSLSNGDSFEHTFDAAGEYDYICAIHPSMKGHISVK